MTVLYYAYIFLSFYLSSQWNGHPWLLSLRPQVVLILLPEYYLSLLLFLT